MIKGQRPSKHYRSVKTRKGKKKVLVNKNIHKKKRISKKRSASPFMGIRKRKEKLPMSRVPISEMSPDELARMAIQQTQMNFLQELDVKAELEQEVPELIKEAKQRSEAERDRYYDKNKIKRKFDELEGIASRLKRKRKPENKFKDFQKYDSARKLTELNLLAKKIGDEELINNAMNLNNKYKDIFSGDNLALQSLEPPKPRGKTYTEQLGDLLKETKQQIKEMDPYTIVKDDVKRDSLQVIRKRILSEMADAEKEIARTKNMPAGEAKGLAERVANLRREAYSLRKVLDNEK